MGAEPLPGGGDGVLHASSAGPLTTISLDRDPGATARARRFVVDQPSHTATETVLHNAMLVASELVTNTLVHREGKVVLSLQIDRDQVRLEVTDQGSGAVIEKREREPGMTRGWGLQIVDELSERWGASDGTTRVWAELLLTQ
jgi:anti-sigma regulatory factor (Ser/Thr protein kinase)